MEDCGARLHLEFRMKTDMYGAGDEVVVDVITKVYNGGPNCLSVVEGRMSVKELRVYIYNQDNTKLRIFRSHFVNHKLYFSL